MPLPGPAFFFLITGLTLLGAALFLLCIFSIPGLTRPSLYPTFRRFLHRVRNFRRIRKAQKNGAVHEMERGEFAGERGGGERGGEGGEGWRRGRGWERAWEKEGEWIKMKQCEGSQ